MKTKEGMFNEPNREHIDECERNRKCITDKIDELIISFEKDTITTDEGLISELEKFNSKIKNVKLEWITKASHLSHIIVSLNVLSSFVGKLNVLRESGQGEMDKAREYEKVIAENKDSLYKYVTMCLKDTYFLQAELSSQHGFWGKNAITIDENDLGVAEMSVNQFVRHTWEHFKDNKVLKEDFDLAA